MFSELRNYSKHIELSERFYYDNYDYYNASENLEKDYKDDLSKFIYHCNRRSTPAIVLYGSRLRFEHARNLKGDDSLTMEEFLNGFVSVFMENNYGLPSKNYEDAPTVDAFQLIHWGPLADIKYEKFCPFKMYLLSQQELAGCLAMLSESYKNKIQALEEAYATNEQTHALKISQVEFHFALELYSDRIVSTYMENTESQNFLLLFEFVVEMHRLLWESLNSRVRTVLLLAQPKLPYINQIIHPLVLPIMTFLKYNNQNVIAEQAQISPTLFKLVGAAVEAKPRIVFINLDGQETSHNLRSIATLKEEIMYVSLFREPDWLEKKETSMDNLFASDDENFEPSYAKLWQIYSKAIIEELKIAQSSSDAKFWLFPLNSSHLQSKYTQRFFQAHPSTDPSEWKNFRPGRIDTSQDIHALFEHIIFEEIRMYQPTMIFISYSGQLNILEEHFDDIVRNCSVLTEHRVVLFSNFTNLFLHEPFSAGEDEEQVDKLMCANEFYHKYTEYKIDNLNQERLFGNISMFLKFGPGLCSMEDRHLGRPNSKYQMGRFYRYLEALTKLEQFEFVQHYRLQKWHSDELTTLYGQYQAYEIRENRKENKYYEKILSIIVSQLLCRNISEDKLQNILGKKLWYRLKFIIEELLWDYYQVRNALAEIGALEPADERRQTKQFVAKLLEDYLEEQKERLLSENLENYKIKKYFHLGENQKSFGQVSCFRFVLSNGSDQCEQIYLEKYSQVIINEEYQEIYIVNYKGPDNRHMILHGTIKNSQIEKDTVLFEVKETDLQMSEEVNEYLELHELDEDGLINQKQDIVFIQYNYCIYERTLYLFWPLMWNLREEARCKILGLEYKPKRVNRMLKVFQYQNEPLQRYESLKYEPNMDGNEVHPRWGCTCQSINQQSFVIIGGIFDNENDYKMIGTGLSHVTIRDIGKCKGFSIVSLPKSNNKNEVIACIKPQINYVIKPAQEKGEENCLRVLGGYGRNNTGFFHMFSSDQYDLNNSILPRRCLETKFQRRVVNTEQPLQCDRIGKFNVILNNYNISQIQQKFSDAPKDKFVFHKGGDGSNKGNDPEIMVFIDETYRVNEYKTDPKKLFLYGFDRTVREKIYTKCWSPQMYVVEGNKEIIINLTLKTEKTSSYIITNYLMPREEDIVSLCLEEDRVYLVSNSPIIHSIDRAGLKFVLYEGTFANMNEVLRRREVQMIARHNFDEKHEKFLALKTMFLHDDKIYLVGGLCVQHEQMGDVKYEREDYIMKYSRNKYKIKTRRVELNSLSLDLPNSVAVKEPEHYLLYSIAFEESPASTDLNEGIEWKVKIEKHSFENSDMNEIRMGGFRVYAYSSNSQAQPKVQKYLHSNLEEPKFVRIVPYTRFSIELFREIIAKIVYRIDKNEEKRAAEFQPLKKLHGETSDEQLRFSLLRERKTFENIIGIVKSRSQESAEANFQDEELLKELKRAYFLVSKATLERDLHVPGQVQPGEHMFIVEDKSSRKVKYIAIGQLNTTRLNFFRLRFKNELSISLNQGREEGLFYHPRMVDYYNYEYENLKPTDFSEYACEEVVRPLNVSVKQ